MKTLLVLCLMCVAGVGHAGELKYNTRNADGTPTVPHATAEIQIDVASGRYIGNEAFWLLPLNEYEEALLEETNARRVANGLPPFEGTSVDIQRTARKHAAWMANSNSMVHGSYGVAENIAMGQRSPKEVLDTWMGSSGHRANILNRAYTRFGCSCYTNERGTVYWCQQFAGPPRDTNVDAPPSTGGGMGGGGGGLRKWFNRFFR